MKNVTMEVKGNLLHITVDLAQEHGPSSSGKSICVASTEGNQPVGVGDIKIGLNVYKPIK